ncbi:hypothetical protein OIV83_000232 [Microbotryomycetes sp. JL201]|nr:hypothetical protein OIV83_000232 [Microbotryomycetes sp. JL201]
MSSVDDNVGYADGELRFLIYGYVPSMAAAITFTVLFALITLVQTGYVIKSRSWWLIVLLLGGIGEVIGWAGGRLWSSQHVYQLDPFLIQICCATLYATLGLVIRSLDPMNRYSVIKPRNYALNQASSRIVIQAVGGAMSSMALQRNESADTGTHIMVAGVCIQLAAMLAFVICAIVFWRRVRQDPELPHRLRGNKTKWLAYGSAWASFWILLRCVYRVIELAEGWTGYLITTEPFFWGLDAIPMVLTQAVFLFTWPTWCVEPIQKQASAEAGAVLSPTDTIIGGDMEAAKHHPHSEKA